MFGKLLKHELRANAGLFCILSAAALILGSLGSIATGMLVTGFEDSLATENGISILSAILLFIFAIFGLIAYMISSLISLFHRFYKRHFSDEGYLTFTLPATAHEILLSSIVSIAIWMVLTAVVYALSVLIMMIPVYHNLFEEMEAIKSTFAQVAAEVNAQQIIQGILQTLATALQGLLLPLLAITIGCFAAKKHKTMAVIGMYFGLNMLLSMTTLFGEMMFIYLEEHVVNVMAWGIPVFNLLIAVGSYFLMHHLVSRKLNLP